MSSRCRLLLLVVAGLLAISTVAFQVFRTESARGQRKLAGQEVVGAYAPRTVVSAFPAISDPPTMSLEEAQSQLRPDELVLGVTVNGASRAYPLNQLTGPSREVFNDELGGEAIAATW